MARIVLKIDVDTLRGTREGVPNLARIFDRFKARATFLFSLGPDHTGWAMRRVLRPGFLKKVSRTSVAKSSMSCSIGSAGPTASAQSSPT